MRSVILAASGPSLNTDKLAETTLPIAAISTAVRVLPFANFWFFIDPPNLNYGPDRGMKFISDPYIRKICPSRRQNTALISAKHPNLECVEYSTSDELDAKNKRRFMDGKMPLLRTNHLSLPFAIQFLVMQGYTRLIFAGVDLNTNTKRPRVWGDFDEQSINKKKNPTGKMTVANAAFQQNKHNRLFETLKAWAPIAKANGIEFLNWSPGSRLNQIMPWWDAQKEEHGSQESSPQTSAPCCTSDSSIAAV